MHEIVRKIERREGKSGGKVEGVKNLDKDRFSEGSYDHEVMCLQWVRDVTQTWLSSNLHTFKCHLAKCFSCSHSQSVFEDSKKGPDFKTSLFMRLLPFINVIKASNALRKTE